MKKRKRKYTPGFADIERVLDTLDEQYKKAKRDEWLREHHGDRRPKIKKEGHDEN